MSKTYLLLGADIGDKRTTFAKAKQLIGESVGRIIRESSLYESAAWGFKNDTTFLNQVLEVETSLSPLDLLDGLQKIENELGRTRSGNGYESRLIDIDILFYDDLVTNTSELTVPHPHLHKRMFTLAPLSELALNYIHPVLHKSVSRLKAECTDRGVVRKING
ncbi:MAG: 2-amino-4-hydroxy-6-hydroxymethyldihydropteridine diphosphokinase [Prevotellaceae bacterium]|jgi:2-amino-4-hydroxy-6-hydroxymethyldihydropteridine diphosphokinase|nr:2-amino-4-hydroxy-6-hydroxymethyldihydropteridine diphosphokinase [Prevotellaceae bacterium]